MDICDTKPLWWRNYWGVLWRKVKKKRQIGELADENVIKKKGNKLYAKWKDDDNSFIS